MFSSQKNVFWQAFLITVLIFSLGIIFGIILENWRTGKIDILYQQSELYLMDIKLQTEIYSAGYFDCDEAVRENIKFADKIYNEAKLLDRYETASEIRDDLIIRHKKYDILRGNLLLNSMKIRQRCNSSYYEVVYIYKYNNKALDIQARQNIFSKLLIQLKEKKGADVLLIPISQDNDLSSVNLIMSMYNINENDLPIIIINGKIRISELETIDDLLRNFE